MHLWSVDDRLRATILRGRIMIRFGVTVLRRRQFVVAFAIAIAVSLGLTAQAPAISAPIHIANTGGEGVNIRSEPTAHSAKVGWMPEGTSPDYNCFVWGERINGVPIWFNVSYGGVTGYYASYYDDSSYHSNEELTAKYGVPLCGAAPPPPTPPPPAPTPPPSTPPPSSGGALVFTVFNAEGGIYYRNSPRWADTSATPGVGVYDGDQVELICGAFGDPVGPYSDTAWSKVKNLTRPSIGEGWVNEHYVNDGATSNHWPASEPMCPGSSSTTPSGGPVSVFFSPNDNPTAAPGGHALPAIATTNLPKSAWGTGDACSALRAVPATPAGASVLAGWSDARLGPIYFLDAAPAQRVAEVHTIILFDPGNTGDFAPPSNAQQIWDWLHGADPTTCDWQYPINSLLADWLSSNAANQLLVLTGAASEEGEKFSGLWHYYFAGIWKQPFANRARVCDYPGMGHPDVLFDFWQIVKNPPSSGCPAPPGGTAPHPWNP
jgi:hypothetical protein